MTEIIFKRLIPVCFALVLVSCGDDPELVAKSEKQKVEIASLEGELRLIEEKLKTMPADASEELEEMRKQTEAQATEVEQLEAEIKELTERRQDLRKEFESYRSKYRAK